MSIFVVLKGNYLAVNITLFLAFIPRVMRNPSESRWKDLAGKKILSSTLIRTESNDWMASIKLTLITRNYLDNCLSVASGQIEWMKLLVKTIICPQIKCHSFGISHPLLKIGIVKLYLVLPFCKQKAKDLSGAFKLPWILSCCTYWRAKRATPTPCEWNRVPPTPVWWNGVLPCHPSWMEHGYQPVCSAVCTDSRTTWDLHRRDSLYVCEEFFYQYNWRAI